MSAPFKFKQFTVEQDRCAMKIGTDGVLLGAWATLQHHPQSILDIGSGTGVIALQLAQRSTAPQIDAIEIDPEAYEQCVENFENSPWNDRLFCYHASLEEFTEEIDEQYDLIVSNPPFYEGYNHTDDHSRNTARSTTALSYAELLRSARKLLHPTGKFCLVIPFKNESSFLRTASKNGIFPDQICRVRGNAEAGFKRVMACLVSENARGIEEELTIETARHVYTQEYIDLVADFYLKM